MVPRGLVAAWMVVLMVLQATIAQAGAAEVESLIAKGNELRRAGKPGPALPYFQKAYELARTPRTTGQLGLAELAAGYPVEAADHLAAALRSPNDPSIVKYQQILADALTMARSQIGELSINGTPAGAEVVIDGRQVGTLPLSLPVKLPARNVELVIRAPGHTPHQEVMPIGGGQRHELTVNLHPIPQPAEPTPIVKLASGPSAPTPVPAPAAPVSVVTAEARSAGGGDSSSGLRTAAWIVGGGAVLAAGSGLALNLVARSNHSDYDAWQTYRDWSIAGYVSGAALAVTSGILLWASRPESPAANTHARLTCAPTPSGLSCEGVF